MVRAFRQGPHRFEVLGQPARLCARRRAHLHRASVLAERVQDFVRAGMLVPPSFVLGKYVAMLSMLPPCSAVDVHRNSLECHVHAAKKWSRRFRDDWGLSWGSPSLPHGVSEQASARRAGVFIRWIRHVLFQRIAPRQAVVINVDETNLGNVKQWKRGVTAAAGEEHLADTLAKDAAMPRTSLIASVCSDEAIQAKLPQIRLPRGRGGKLPSRIVASCYAEAGAPQVAVHGSSGFRKARTLAWYVRLVARAVRTERPILCASARHGLPSSPPRWEGARGRVQSGCVPHIRSREDDVDASATGHACLRSS